MGCPDASDSTKRVEEGSKKEEARPNVPGFWYCAI